MLQFLFLFFTVVVSEKLIVEWPVTYGSTRASPRDLYKAMLPSRRGYSAYSSSSDEGSSVTVHNIKPMMDSVFDGKITEPGIASEPTMTIRTLNAIGLDIVEVNSREEAYRVKRLIESQGGIVEYDDAIQIISAPTDPKYSELWGMNAIGADKMRDYMGPSNVIPYVIVAVFDTGTTLKHEDLRDQLWVNEKELNGLPGVDDDGNGYVDDIYGYDFHNNKGTVEADHNHGPHVAGTILATGDNGAGVAGVWWRAKLMTLKILDHQGSGSYSAAIAAINYASAMGAHVGNHSWGGSTKMEALKAALWNSPMIHICAAGNDSKNNDVSQSYPAGHSVELTNVVSVAATSKFSTDLASFSNWGPRTVDLSAPGESITSTCRPNVSGVPYCTMSGTSMATPHVTGVAAAAWEMGIKTGYSFGSKFLPTAADIKKILISSVTKLQTQASKTITGGQVNAYGAVIEMENLIKSRLPVTTTTTRATTTTTTTTTLPKTTTTTTLPGTTTTTTLPSGADGEFPQQWANWGICYGGKRIATKIEITEC